MKDIETIIDDLCQSGRLDAVDSSRKQRLHSALVASLVKAHSATDPEEMHDLVPIHMPIDFRYDEESGNWQIRFPYRAASSTRAGWRVLDIQTDALQVLAAHIVAELRAGRLTIPTHTTPNTIQ